MHEKRMTPAGTVNRKLGPASQLRRREVLAASMLLPVIARAQSSRDLVKIGHLESGSPGSSPELLAAFREGMSELGYPPASLQIESRYAEGQADRLAALASDLVQVGPRVIFAIGASATLAAARATNRVPIVFVGGGDPVEMGLVKSIARPGTNVTGLTLVHVDLAPKRLALLKAAVPASTEVTALWNPENGINRQELDKAFVSARDLRVEVASAPVRSLAEIERVLNERRSPVLILSSPLTFSHRPQIAALATRNHVPTIGALREYTSQGILMSYGPGYADYSRRAAVSVDRILKGAEPGDLPIQLPAAYEFVINLKTAAAIGLTVPTDLVAQADHFFE